MRKFFIAFLLVWFFAAPSLAAGGSLTLSSSSLKVQAGKTFTVAVKATSDGVIANTVGADISYPADMLDAVSISGPTVITIPIAYDVVAPGTVSFQGGIMPSRTLASSAIGTILFKAKKAGIAAIAVASTSGIYADDGQGTNLLTGFGKISIDVAAATSTTPTPTPPIIAPPIVNSPIVEPPIVNTPTEIQPPENVPAINQPVNAPEPGLPTPPQGTFGDSQNIRQTFMNAAAGFAATILILIAYSFIRYLAAPRKKRRK